MSLVESVKFILAQDLGTLSPRVRAASLEQHNWRRRATELLKAYCKLIRVDNLEEA